MPTIVHFDLPTDDPERAKKFCEKLFDWKFDKVPMPEPYYLIETKDLEGNPGVRGGMGKRGQAARTAGLELYRGPFSRRISGKGRETRWQYLHAKNSCAGLGVSCGLC